LTLSSLRPSGKANIGGKRIRVETEGDFLDENVMVKVVRQVEGRVIVRKAANSETSDQQTSDQQTSDQQEVA
jgi:membrane-bound ClpP family serine protease